MTPSERSRSLILPTTAPSSTEVRRERGSDSQRENGGSSETDTAPSTIEYPENIDLFVLQDDESWPFLDETCKLASNTASFSFVVNMDGIVPLDEVDTLLNTWASFPEDDDEPPGLVPDDEEDEVLHAAIARAVKQRRKGTGTGKCRVSGVPDQNRGETGTVLGNPKP